MATSRSCASRNPRAAELNADARAAHQLDEVGDELS